MSDDRPLYSSLHMCTKRLVKNTHLKTGRSREECVLYLKIAAKVKITIVECFQTNDWYYMELIMKVLAIRKFKVFLKLKFYG